MLLSHSPPPLHRNGRYNCHEHKMWVLTSVVWCLDLELTLQFGFSEPSVNLMEPSDAVLRRILQIWIWIWIWIPNQIKFQYHNLIWFGIGLISTYITHIPKRRDCVIGAEWISIHPHAPTIHWMIKWQMNLKQLVSPWWPIV